MDNSKIFSCLWLSLLVALCVPIQATLPNPQTLSEVLPAYAIARNVDILNSSKCRTEIQQFHEGVERGTLWSLRMLDASGMASSGFINGNNYWLGERMQCDFLSANVTLQISEKLRRNNSIYRNPNEEFPPFELHYFVAKMRHYSTQQYHVGMMLEDRLILGLCLPASCTENELATILDKVLRDDTFILEQLYTMNLTLLEVSDLRNDQQWLLSGKMLTVIFILVLIFGLVVVGTLYDILIYQKSLQRKKEFITYENNNTSELKSDLEEKREIDQEEAALSELKPENNIGQYIVCFSFYSNVQQTFKISESSDGVPVFHCLRFFGMIWIIMLHTIYYADFVIRNKVIAYEMTDSFMLQILANGTFSVDTYFFMSGFLLSYVFLKIQQKEKKTKRLKKRLKDFLLSLVKRYIRITPAYFVVILIAILNYSWYDRISMFLFSERPNIYCSKYWWRDLLYINNLFDWDNMCLSWSWYLSNDMQFYIIGSLVLILSTTHFNIAVGLCIVTLIASMLSNAYTVYSINYIPTLDEQYATLKILYIRPWLRIQPYLIGMGTAHLLSRWNNKLHLSKTVLTACWTFAFICIVSILFGLMNKYIDLSLSVLYTSLSRTGWGIVIGWLTIACCTNNAGVLNKLLSLPVWVPLGRLTYCSYLLNPFILTSIYLYSSYSVNIDLLMTGTISFGASVVTYICALVLSTTVEVPFIQLLRIFVNSKRRMK